MHKHKCEYLHEYLHIYVKYGILHVAASETLH